jgi:hypothetical protein
MDPDTSKNTLGLKSQHSTNHPIELTFSHLECGTQALYTCTVLLMKLLKQNTVRTKVITETANVLYGTGLRKQFSLQFTLAGDADD